MNRLDYARQLHTLDRYYMGKEGLLGKPAHSKMAQTIRKRANHTLGVLGMEFVFRGSGQFVELRRLGRMKNNRSMAPPKKPQI
jgi:hypothetical protein